jgi:hypothetical protein
MDPKVYSIEEEYQKMHEHMREWAREAYPLKPMPKYTFKHGDIDRIPDCFGYWIHVMLDEQTLDPVSTQLLLVTSSTTYTDSERNSAFIKDLPHDDRHVYVFLW